MNLSSKNNNSLAYSCGLAPNSKSMTLNPNLNIQDQYVENLLKQIQFLTLESKLLREKQSVTKGCGLMSLVNKQNRPVVDHLLISGDKYKGMRDDLLNRANALTISTIELEGQQRGLIKRRDYIDKKRKEAEEKNNDQRKRLEEIVGDLQSKLRAEKARLEDLEKENLRLNKGQEFSEGELQKINRDNENNTILAETQSKRLKKEQQLEQEDQVKKQSTIAKIKKQISELNERLENNAKYKEIEQENKELVKQYEQQERQLSELHFKLVQTEHIYKLAEVERDKEIRERRAAQEELEATEGFYKEIVKVNEAKIEKKKKLRVNDSVEVKKGEASISKLEKELAECRRRSDRAIEAFNKYSMEERALKAQQDKMKAKKAKFQQTLAKLVKDNGALDIQKQELQKGLITSQKQVEKLKKDNAKWSAMLIQAQELYTELYEQFQFLQGSVTLQQEIKKVRVEDLRSVVQKNIDVNNTVMDLMNKWNDIQNFGRS